MKLDGSEVRRLLHHRSRPFNSYNYQPHVSVSRDGSILVYNSNFGLQSLLGYPKEYADMYLVTVPGAVSTASAGASGGTGGSSTPSSRTVLQETDPAVLYSGSWFAHANAAHDGGGARLAMDAGSRATVKFSGGSITWTGHQDEWSGIANVYLDGALAATVDTCASPAAFRTTLFSKTGLAAGSHTLIVEATGSHGALSAGAWIWIDTIAFETTGLTVPGPPTPGATAGDSSVPGDGTWYIKSSNGGNVSVSRSPDSPSAASGSATSREGTMGAAMSSSASIRPGSPANARPASGAGWNAAR